MKRICKYCGTEYEGDSASSCCPSCAARQRASTLRPRICKTCGTTFPGGPRALYCPSCRADRRRAQDRAAKERKRAGVARSIGSTDLCSVCGRPYAVESGLQRYCPDCAPEAVREKDRQAARVWAAANTTPEQRRETRRNAAAPVACAVCGKPFRPGAGNPVTCSPECKAAYKQQWQAKWEKAHREERSAYRRARRQKND